ARSGGAGSGGGGQGGGGAGGPAGPRGGPLGLGGRQHVGEDEVGDNDKRAAGMGMLEPLHGIAFFSRELGAAGEMAGARQEQGTPALVQDHPVGHLGEVSVPRVSQRPRRPTEASPVANGGAPSRTRAGRPPPRPALIA